LRASVEPPQRTRSHRGREHSDATAEGHTYAGLAPRKTEYYTRETPVRGRQRNKG